MSHDQIEVSGIDRMPDPRTLLRQFGLRAEKRLGQNFLFDQKALRKIIRAAQLEPGDTVLEIGAGLGSLTYHLSKAARRVIAVEYDLRLVPALESVISTLEGVELVVGDILQIDLATLIAGDSYKVVANIPYNITSLLIRRLMTTASPASNIILTIQKEVAERIIASPGDMNLLALGVQLYGNPRIAASIKASSFYPQPNVDSAVLFVATHPIPILDPQLIDPLFRLARAAFGQKRKQLRNSLAAGMQVQSVVAEEWLKKAGIDPRTRPQDLSIMEWERLTRSALPFE
jgi:16S rRNA (adenine1518-N6/adenine1519-N6)-dimethyltransferase